MAEPKVFVSSTCYDLKEIRDNLYEFIVSLGFTPVFSDKNDVFYHPDLHTHEACIKEIENCQLFVLIIGGRFGGTYKYDDKRSIVNAEYDAAKKLCLPIFAFVQKEVYSNQFTYIKNIKNNLAEKIEYPAIADQKYAKNIFEFITNVRKADENNGLFEFEFARDLKSILLKQFAGLFYDFLWNRKKQSDLEVTKKVLYDLSSISKKTEELLENIYRKVDENDANALISKLDAEDQARKFLYLIAAKFSATFRVLSPDKISAFCSVDNQSNWISHLLTSDQYELVTPSIGEQAIKHIVTGRQIVFKWPREENQLFITENAELLLLNTGFEAFKKLTPEKRIELVTNFAI